MSRPWGISSEVWGRCMKLVPEWLNERGGVVVYQNQNFDSSHFGERSFMPARFLAEEDNEFHDAPEERRPNGGLPSLRQQKVDHIMLKEFGGELDVLLAACFKEDEDG